MKAYVRTKIYTQMVIEALYVKAKNFKITPKLINIRIHKQIMKFRGELLSNKME